MVAHKSSYAAGVRTVLGTRLRPIITERWDAQIWTAAARTTPCSDQFILTRNGAVGPSRISEVSEAAVLAILAVGSWAPLRRVFVLIRPIQDPAILLIHQGAEFQQPRLSRRYFDVGPEGRLRPARNVRLLGEALGVDDEQSWLVFAAYATHEHIEGSLMRGLSSLAVSSAPTPPFYFHILASSNFSHGITVVFRIVFVGLKFKGSGNKSFECIAAEVGSSSGLSVGLETACPGERECMMNGWLRISRKDQHTSGSVSKGHRVSLLASGVSISTSHGRSRGSNRIDRRGLSAYKVERGCALCGASYDYACAASRINQSPPGSTERGAMVACARGNAENWGPTIDDLYLPTITIISRERLGLTRTLDRLIVGLPGKLASAGLLGLDGAPCFLIAEQSVPMEVEH
ncbi:hypothetical protein V8F20_004352 [Naviculisporaceae sp. PSN 640]